MQREAAMHGVLPAIYAPSASFNVPRGVSPNVAKRAAWSTPRMPAASSPVAEVSVSGPDVADSSTVDNHRDKDRELHSASIVAATFVSLEDALEVLQAVLVESENQSDSAQRRETALEEVRRLQTAEQQELERTQLVTDEQLHTTVELLQAELARERRLRTADRAENIKTAAPPVTKTKNSSKCQTARLAPRLRNSPLKPRTKDPASVRSPKVQDRETAEEGGVFDDEVRINVSRPSTRGSKSKELQEECAGLQRDYEAMREQVIAEKARQVALFQRLEVVRKSHANQLNQAEAALRASQQDAERLQARLAHARVSATHEVRRMTTLIQNSLSERQRLVCALAETRHKFREWKEGEASTLRAAREQAVHALRTEYELKLARHQEEKQKLRDKVKDLEVSLRLLQRDRQMSPGELSERKGTMLQLNASGVVNYVYGAADLIEAQGRVQELEALLALSKEQQDRQDALLHESETALARLNQERELEALESLTLPSPAASFAISNFTADTHAKAAETTTIPTPLMSPSDLAPTKPTPLPPSTPTRSVTPSTPLRSPPKQQNNSGNSATGPDVEKELLRRNSIILSSEVDRYQKIVVQSMEEVRALKESRRVSRTGSINASTSARESFLLGELAVAKHEIKEMENKLKQCKGEPKAQGTAENDNSDADSGSDDGKNSKDSEDENFTSESSTSIQVPASATIPRLSLVNENRFGEGEAEQPSAETAVKVIQTYSRRFLARREFIRKKLAIGKIKARYRGYLVRKNYEALGSSWVPTDRRLHPSGLAPLNAPNLYVVTEAMQYKMQIVEPHHKMTSYCEDQNGGNNQGQMDVILRVSKDPPLLQLQVIPITVLDQVPRVAYFHLFETIALLSYEDEEVVLESSNEKEIAGILSSRLVVQRKDSDSDYQFFIVRPSKNHTDGANNAGEPIISRNSRTLLTELPVQQMEVRAKSAVRDKCETSFEKIVPPGDSHEVDLDRLIREARSDPLDNEAKSSVSGVKPAEDPTLRVRRLVKGLSSRAFGDL